MKLLISGWYGFKNAGDELLLDIFLEKNRNHEVTVLTQGDISIEKVKSVFHSDIFRFDSGGIKQWLTGKTFKVLLAIYRTDIFVLGGGGIIREAGNFTNLHRILDEIWICNLLRKKILIYGVSIGPIKSNRGVEMIKKALLKCDYITVRDERSIQYLEQFGISKEKYSMHPDPGFVKQDNLNQALNCLDLSKAIIDEERIPIFPALGLIHDGKDSSWLTPFAEALDDVYIKTNRKFVALPFRHLGSNSIDDVYVSHELKSRLKYKDCLTVYESELDHSQLSTAMRIAGYAIAVRLHSMILAITNEVPFVAINYDTKVFDTARVAGLASQVVQLDADFKVALVNQIVSMIENRSQLQGQVLNSSVLMAKKANKLFEVLDKEMRA